MRLLIIDLEQINKETISAKGQALEKLRRSEVLTNQMFVENSKLKDHLTKLSKLKGFKEKEIKICEVCGEVFEEKNNFKWSCRSH